jgi:hypothetical protein
MITNILVSMFSMFVLNTQGMATPVQGLYASWVNDNCVSNTVIYKGQLCSTVGYTTVEYSATVSQEPTLFFARVGIDDGQDGYVLYVPIVITYTTIVNTNDSWE